MRDGIINFFTPKKIIGSVSVLVERLPLVLPASLASFSLVVMILLVFGQLRSVLVIALGIPVVILTVFVVCRHEDLERPGSSREKKLFDILALIGVVTWIAFNAVYTSQNVFVYRDPATYVITGSWLINHDNLAIKDDNVFGDKSSAKPDSGGFHEHPSEPGVLFAQGQHLLPSLLGLLGRFAGESKMLHTLPVFGGIALLSVYGFARMIANPRWAFMLTMGLGLSLPMLYFSRDAYTESLAMTFTFGALSLLWIAQKKKRESLYFIAGLTAGAALLARIDAYLSIVGFSGALLLAFALSKPKNRAESLRHVILFSLGVGLMAIISWTDITLLSRDYFEASESLILKELIILGSVFVVGGIVTLIGWNSNLMRRIDAITRRWRKQVVFISIFTIALAFVLRPYWAVEDQRYEIQNIGGRQSTINYYVNIDGGNPYFAENVTTWAWWYLGAGITLSGLAGLALAASMSTRRKDLLMLPALFVVIGTSVVFFTQPSITPDQPWASRRLLPVILPGLVVFAAFTFSKISEKNFAKAKSSQIALFIVCIAITLYPLSMSKQFLLTREGVPQLSQIQAVCESLPKNSAVLWLGVMSVIAVQSTRAYCDVPSEGLDHMPTQQQLAHAAKSARSSGYTPVIGLINSDGAQLPSGSKIVDVSNVQYETIELVFRKPPQRTLINSRTISVGQIQDDGTIVNLQY